MSDDLIKRSDVLAALAPMLRDMISRGKACEIVNSVPASDRIEQLEAKLIIAVAYIRRHIPDSIYEQRQQARAVLAKLEGKE